MKMRSASHKVNTASLLSLGFIMNINGGIVEGMIKMGIVSWR